MKRSTDEQGREVPMAKSRKKSLDQITAYGPSQDELLDDQMNADTDPSHEASPTVLARLKQQIDALNKQYEELAKPPKTKKKTSTPRNHQNERHLAKTRRASALADVRVKRDANGGEEEIFQVAQALILCGLPYDKTDTKRPACARRSWYSRKYDAGQRTVWLRDNSTQGLDGLYGVGEQVGRAEEGNGVLCSGRRPWASAGSPCSRTSNTSGA
jgi:hypothetical protein